MARERADTVPVLDCHHVARSPPASGSATTATRSSATRATSGIRRPFAVLVPRALLQPRDILVKFVQATVSRCRL